jgi:ketosteroid isomerase-like protein
MSPIRMERFESGIRVVLAFHEAFNRQDIPGMLQCISEDCVFESTGPAPDGGVYAGREAITRYWQEFFRESPHAHIEIEEIFGFGFRCIVRWKYTWINAAGNQEHVRGADIFQVQEGSICGKMSYVKG